MQRRRNSTRLEEEREDREVARIRWAVNERSKRVDWEERGMKKERGPKRGEEEGESGRGEERRGREKEDDGSDGSGLEKEEPLVTLPYRTAARIAIAIRSRQ